MRDIPFIPITDPDQYEKIAMGLAGPMRDLLHSAHANSAQMFGTTDAGPMLSGYITGLLMFIADTGGEWDQVRPQILTQADNVWPQIRMNRDAEDRGAPDVEGRA